MTYAEFVKNEDLNNFSTQGATVQATEIDGNTVYFDIYTAERVDDESCIFRLPCSYDTENGTIAILSTDNDAVEEFNLSEAVPPKGTTGLEDVYPTDNPEYITNFDKIMENIEDRLENGKNEYMERYGIEDISTDKIRQEIAKPEISKNQFEELISVIEKTANGLSNEMDQFDESEPVIAEKIEEIFGSVSEITPITVSGWMEGIIPHFEIQIDGITQYDSIKDNIEDLVNAYDQYDYNDKNEIADGQLTTGFEPDFEELEEMEEVERNIAEYTDLPEGAVRIDEEFIMKETEEDDASGRCTDGSFIDSKVTNIFSDRNMQTVRSGFIPMEQRIGSEKSLLTQEDVEEFRQEVPDFGRFLGFDTTDITSAKTYIVSQKDFSKVCEGLFAEKDGKFEVGSYGAYSDRGVFEAKVDDIKEIKLHVEKNSIGGLRQSPVTADGSPIKGNIERLSNNEICYKIYDRGDNKIATLADIKDGQYEDKGYYTALDDKGRIDVFHDTKINTARIDGVRVDTFNLCTIEVKDRDGQVFKNTCLIDAKGNVMNSDLFSATNGPETRLYVRAEANIPVLNQFETKENSYRSVSNDLKDGQSLEEVRGKYELTHENNNLSRAVSVFSADMRGRMDRIDRIIEEKSFERNGLEKSVNFKELGREICATSLSNKINDISKQINAIDKGKETESPEKISSMKSELAEKIEDYHRVYQQTRPSESVMISSQAIGIVQGVRAEIETLQETKEDYASFAKEIRENSPQENLARISRIEAGAVDRCTIHMDIDEQFINVTSGERGIIEQEIEKYNKDLPENEHITLGKDGIYTEEGCAVLASDSRLTIPSYEADSERQIENLYNKDYDKTGIGDNFSQKSKEIQYGNKTPLEKSHYAGITLVAEHIRGGIVSPMDIIPKIIEENCYDTALKQELLEINSSAVETSGVDYIEEVPENIEKDNTGQSSIIIDDSINNDTDKDTEYIDYGEGKGGKPNTSNLDKYLKAFSGSYAHVDITKDVELSDKTKKEIDDKAERDAKDPITGKVDVDKKEELKEKYTKEKINELEQIKVRIASGLEKQERYFDSIPRKAQHTDTPITINNFNIDRAAYEYIKAGGKFGKGCLLENGVTSTYLISDLVTIQHSNLLVSIEWRIIDAVTSGIEKILFGEVIGRESSQNMEANNSKDIETTEENKTVDKDILDNIKGNENIENDFPKEMEITDKNDLKMETEKDDTSNDTDKENETDHPADETALPNDALPDNNMENLAKNDLTENAEPEETMGIKEVEPENIELEDIKDEDGQPVEDTEYNEIETDRDKSDAAAIDDSSGDIDVSEEDGPDEGIQRLEDDDSEDDTDRTEKETEAKEDQEEIEPEKQEEDVFDSVDMAEESMQNVQPEDDHTESYQDNEISSKENSIEDNDDTVLPDQEQNVLANNDTDGDMENTKVESDTMQDSFWQYEDGYIPSPEEIALQDMLDEASLRDRDFFESEPVGVIDGVEFTTADMDYILDGGTMDYEPDMEWNNDWQMEADQQYQDAVQSSVDMVSNGIDELTLDMETMDNNDITIPENIEIDHPDMEIGEGGELHFIEDSGMMEDIAGDIISKLL